jgi:hypothetical protein
MIIAVSKKQQMLSRNVFQTEKKATLAARFEFESQPGSAGDLISYDS